MCIRDRSPIRARTYISLDVFKGLYDYFKFRHSDVINSIEFVDAFVYPSYYSYTLHIETYPEIKEKINKVIYNPVLIPRLDEMNRTTTEHIIIYPSLSNEMKGYHILLRALPLLDRIISEKTKVVLVGLKDRLEYVKRFLHVIRKLEVVITDRLPRQTLLKTIASANLVVTPFVIPDPAPRVVVEALKLGTPVISSNIGGAREFLSLVGLEMLMTRPNDHLELALKIFHALNMPFDSKIIIQRTEEIFNSVRFRRSFIKLVDSVV